MHFVNPFTDIGFKIIFGQEASKDLLITLLNELLLGEHHIEDLTFLDKEDRSNNISDRGIVYDLYCRTSTGEYIIVEMQNRWHSNFLDRTLFYVCRAISRQTENPDAIAVNELLQAKLEGQKGSQIAKEEAVAYGRQQSKNYGDRYKLSTVYGIFLMNFEEEGLEPKFRTDTVIADRENGRVVNAHFRQIYLQFPFFQKELAECKTLYDKLIYTLKNMMYWNRMPDELKDQVFQRLNQLAAVANLSEDNRIAYDKAVDSIMIGIARDESMLMKGIQQGLQQGIQQGVQQGRITEKQENAQNLKKLGVSIDIIAQATGLTAEEIDKL